MKSKKKQWKYHVWHSFEDCPHSYRCITQLYQIGVYAIVNDDPAMQLNLKPDDLVKLEKNLVKDFASGAIQNLQFGREITVTVDEHGFYKEVKE